MKVVFGFLRTEFSAELIKMNSGKATWNNLKLSYNQISDTGVTTEIVFNSVSKEELLELSNMFAQLAKEA